MLLLLMLLLLGDGQAPRPRPAAPPPRPAAPAPRPFYTSTLPADQLRNKQAVLETSQGTIVLDLLADAAPNHVAHFITRAREGAYDGTTFHRVVAMGMIQGGDPLSKDPKNPRVGTGGPGYTIKCETHRNTHKHVAGTLSMAHAGKDTGGSQFFICHSPQPHLDKVHTVFGQVTSGMDVVNGIKQGDEITSIRVS